MVFRSVVIKVKKGNVNTSLHQHQDPSSSSRLSSKFSEHCSFEDFLVIFDSLVIHVKKKNVLIKIVCWLNQCM